MDFFDTFYGQIGDKLDTIFLLKSVIIISGEIMEKIKIKKTIDNHMYCHKINVLLEEDDYAILDRYKD